jgi:uncharacterized membrane protein affecting hemolysin expression
MPPQRARYARHNVWIFVIIISIVVVLGFAAAAYEINHQRTQINGLQTQLTNQATYEHDQFLELQNALKIIASK